MNSKEIARLELLIVTACLAIAFLFSLINTAVSPFQQDFHSIPRSLINTIADNFLPNFFNFLVIYINYILLCFYIAPELNKKDGSAQKGVLLAFAFLSISIIIGIINIFWAILLAVKTMFILFTGNRNKNEMYFEAGFLSSIWIIVTSALFFLYAHPLIKLYVLLVIPFSMTLYLYAIYYGIPKASKKVWKRSRYFFSMLGLAILSTAMLTAITVPLLPDHNFGSTSPVTFITTISIKLLLLGQSEELSLLIILLGSFLTQMLIITPIAWGIYKDRNALKTEEIITLKTELGKADANLNFLKSQINPHFLFNALNTLYGTALQEKAERTGEGIQKLGDMMRFMLQENVEDKIMLSKDVDYLNNYIALQKLRTSISPDITIETQIDEQINNLFISPMLLIPFVENAFKHGISLQYPSHIKITLQTIGSTLYFDVHNSIHLKQDRDPEKLQSGIGLQNVKQRLELLYPGQHELIIRQNAKEFFIHLTLQLSGND
jgi:sensor histidine kinase YesM